VYVLVTGISDEPSETMVIRNVTRYSDDLYECVASNGVPPAAVRQIRVTVECQYIVHDASPYLSYQSVSPINQSINQSIYLFAQT